MNSYRDPAATWLDSPNYSADRDGLRASPSFIVLHTTDGSLAAANARFQNPASQASAHYGVGLDGSLVQWVDEKDAAWHAGDYQVNLRSIGIEHEDDGNYNSPRPDALYTRSAALVAAICARYAIPVQRGNWPNVPGCIDHRTVYATACPDTLDTDRIISEASLHGGGGGTIGGLPMDQATIEGLAQVVFIACTGATVPAATAAADFLAASQQIPISLRAYVENVYQDPRSVAYRAKRDKAFADAEPPAGLVPHTHPIPPGPSTGPATP